MTSCTWKIKCHYILNSLSFSSDIHICIPLILNHGSTSTWSLLILGSVLNLENTKVRISGLHLQNANISLQALITKNVPRYCQISWSSDTNSLRADPQIQNNLSHTQMSKSSKSLLTSNFSILFLS